MSANDATPTVRLLVLGAGAVVSKCHLPALHQLGLADTTLFVDPSQRSLDALREIYPSTPVLRADFRDVLGDSVARAEFDAVIVALPNRFHEEAVREALAGGLPVLCEKPLALTKESCIRLAKLADETGKILGVAMVRRLLPSMKALRAALSEGLIGELVSVDVEDGAPFAWPAESGFYFQREHGGLLANMGVHYLDLLEDLLGQLHPEEYWDDSAGGVEANFEYRLKTGGGVPVRLAISYTRLFRNTMRFQGSEGDLIVNKDGFDTCLWQAGKSGLTGSLRSPSPFRSGNWRPTFESCFIEQAWEFANAITRAEPARVSAWHAANTMGLIEEGYRRRDSGRRDVTVSAPVGRPVLAGGRVFVTGGTGFVGSRLVERLTEVGFKDIVVPVRSYMTAANVSRFPVQLRRVNLLDEMEVAEAVRGSRYVFHLAYGTGGDDSRAVTVNGTENVLRAAAATRVESMVVLSTATVFGHASTMVDENSPYLPALGEYGRTKAEAERRCLAFARSSERMRVVVLNPAAVYGPAGRTFTEMPPRMAESGAFCWIEHGRGIANYVYVDNLVDAILLAAQHNDVNGERFIVSDGDCTWEEFLTPILRPWLNRIPSYTVGQLRSLSANSPQPGIREMIQAMFSNRELMALISGNRKTAAVKRVFVRAFPHLQRRIQAARQPPVASMFVDSASGPGFPPLWLADLFGPMKMRLSSSKARRVLDWKSSIDLGEGQRRSIHWLQYVRLVPDENASRHEPACRG